MMRILALRTDFSHHGEYSGYKQLLKFIEPTVVLGVDERKGIHTTGIRSKYQWLFERDVRKYIHEIDVIHVMYGEDYLRFAPMMYPNTPVVATFHQPAADLKREVERGDLRGRVGRWTHLISKNRFSKLAAAIVTEQSQKQVLSAVMDPEGIYVIPLGIHLDEFHRVFRNFQSQHKKAEAQQIITVGNWLRDWTFYLETLKAAEHRYPQWTFHLVNRRMDETIKTQLMSCSNLVIHSEVDDNRLKELLYTSAVQFLPVTGASGNNALIEGLAMGCPVVITDVFNGNHEIEEPVLRCYTRQSVDSALDRLSEVVNLSTEQQIDLKNATFARSVSFDWQSVAERTMQVYQKVLRP